MLLLQMVGILHFLELNNILLYVFYHNFFIHSLMGTQVVSMFDYCQ